MRMSMALAELLRMLMKLEILMIPKTPVIIITRETGIEVVTDEIIRMISGIHIKVS